MFQWPSCDEGIIRPISQPTEWLSNILVKENTIARRYFISVTPVQSKLLRYILPITWPIIHYHLVQGCRGGVLAAVKIAKNILKKSRYEDPYLALLAYRNTPQQGHTYSPAQRLMSRRLRDVIPMSTSQLQPQTASPNLVLQDIAGRKRRSKMQYDKRASTTQMEF